MADAGKIVITPKGAYSSTKTYEWLDEVSYNGNAYVALKTVTGVTPSDDGVNWRLFLEPNDIVAGNLVPTFTEASTRSNIISEENLSTILGKVKKYFTDLKGHAFNDTVKNLTTEETGSALDASQGKLLKDEVDNVNDSLDDYGLVNQFDGLLQNGDYKSIDGSLIPSQVKVCTVTKIPVKKGDAVTPKAENVNLYYAQAWNTRGEHIGDITSTWTNVGTPIKIQDDGYVTFTFKLADSGNITPQTAGKISVYINNAISELKNDLGACVTKEYMQKYSGGIVYGQNSSGTGMFVIPLERYIATSLDGVTKWEVDWECNLDSILDSDEIILGITYGNGKFVCFTNKGFVLYSSDAITWTKTIGVIM